MTDSGFPNPIGRRRYHSWSRLETIEHDNQLILRTLPWWRWRSLMAVGGLATLAVIATSFLVLDVKSAMIAASLFVGGASVTIPLVFREYRGKPLLRFDLTTRRLHLQSGEELTASAAVVREFHLNTAGAQTTYVFIATPETCREFIRVAETQPKISPAGALCEAAGVDYHIKAVYSQEDLRQQITLLQRTLKG